MLNLLKKCRLKPNTKDNEIIDVDSYVFVDKCHEFEKIKGKNIEKDKTTRLSKSLIAIERFLIPQAIRKLHLKPRKSFVKHDFRWHVLMMIVLSGDSIFSHLFR